jgi:AcrR family transcriptional regulator
MKMVKAAQKRLWQDPDYVARRSADMKRLFEDPEFRAKHAATHTKVNAEKRQQIVAAARTAPKLTLRQIAKAVGGVSHETVRKVLAEAKGAPRTRK